MKITTKLLLGATLIAGLSVSAFAACATDVDMGNKQLKNVADGSEDGDAVNYAQSLKHTTVTYSEANDSIVAIYGPSYPLTLRKVGKQVCFSSIITNTSGTALSDWVAVMNIGDVNYRPFYLSRTAVSTWDGVNAVLEVTPGGQVRIRTRGSSWGIGSTMDLGACWITQ